MPRPFPPTHPKLNHATECVDELTKTWDEYIGARLTYAEALLSRNWAHQGGRRDENPHRRTQLLSDAYDEYFEKMDTFKRAHAVYKTAIRELLRGHLL